MIWANCLFPFHLSFLLRKVEDVATISKSQSLTSVSIKDCTLRVPNETTTLFLLRVIIKAIFIHDKHLDVMRREEFEEAGKILNDYSDRSAIASIVKDTPPHKEMRRVKQQVRQCLKEVLNDLGYRPAQSEQTRWHTHISHFKKKGDIPTAIKRHLLAIHAHKQKSRITLGLSIKDAHTLRCYMQETHVSVFA